MAKYYSTISSMTDIKNSLIDYYGAGVTIHTETTALLIFSCSAISDKVIKITGFADLIAYYGDSYNGAGDIINPIAFGGTTTTGATSAAEMVCGESFIILTVFATITFHKLWVIGQLTDNQFAVIGIVGSATSSYNIGAVGYLTASATQFYLVGLIGDYQIGSKRAISQLVILTPSGGLYSIDNIITFKDLYSVSRQMGVAASAKGTGHYLTPSGGYTNTTYILTNSIMVEVTN